MKAICKTLKTNLLHLQTPPGLKFSRSKLDSIDTLLSSVDLNGIRIAWEIRGVEKLKITVCLLIMWHPVTS